MALGNLKVTLELVADKFVGGVRTAQKELAGLGATIASPQFQNAAATVGVGFIAMGTAISGALLKSAKSAADYGDAMLELSQKTGITTEALGAYKVIAEQSGTSLNGLATGIKMLSRNMLDAATSTGEQARLFSALGISVKDAQGNMRGTSEVMADISLRFQTMEDGALKNALATKIFGRAGADLIPFLNEGPEGMERGAAAAEKYGLAMTRAEAAIGDKFNDSLAESKLAIEGLQNSIGIVLLPSLTDLVNKGNDWIATASQWAKANPEITSGLFDLSVILIGAGGVLVGLTSIAAILPTVNAGLALIGISGVGAFGVWAAALAGVLLQMKSMVGFADKLRSDPLTAADPTKMSGSDWFSMISIPGALSAGYNYYQGVMNPASPRTPSKLMPGGLTPEAQAAFAAGDPRMRQQAELMKLLEKPGKQASDIDRFAESVAKLRAQYTDTVQPSKELVAMIHELDKEGALTSDVIYALAKDFDTLKNSHDPLIQSIVAGLPFIKMAKEEWKLQAEQIKLVDAATKAYASDLSLLPVDMSMGGIGPALGRGDIEGNQRQSRHEEAIKNLEDQRQAIRDLGDDIVGLNAAGLSATEIEQALGISLESVSEQARELGVNLDPVVSQLSRTQELSQSWGESLGAVSDKLVDMIVDFDFSFKRLGDIAKSTFKDMATSFLDGFMKPFKDGLNDLGQRAGDWAAKLAYGGTGGGGKQGESGGLLGGLLGGGDGGWTERLPWGKSGPSAGDWERQPLPGQGGGGMGGSQGTLGSIMSMNPAGIANDAVDFYNKTFGRIGAGRKSADEIVKSQESFVNQTLAGILSSTSMSASDKLGAVNRAWEDYQSNLDRFSAGGGEGSKNAITANQAFATISPLVSNIQRDLVAAGATEAGASGGGNTINGDVNISFVLPEGITPEGWLDWLYKNKAGIGTAITETVLAMEGAIVTH